MYRGEFVPLYPPHGLEQGQHTKEFSKQAQQTEDCQKKEALYQQKLQKLQEERESLELQLESLQRQYKELQREKEDLLAQMEKRASMESFLNSISERLQESIGGLEQELRREILELVINLLKRILLSDALPKEQVLIRALSRVLDAGVELRGQVNLYLNPADLPRVNSFVEELRERSGEQLQLTLWAKEELLEGEFILETPKLWIERRYEELLQDLLKELKNV